jgi:hypothetical protein
MGDCNPLYHEKREKKAKTLAIAAASLYPFGLWRRH